jgi:hypothetical protein
VPQRQHLLRFYQGELAFSNVTGGSGVLFIGDTSNSTVVAIGGVRNPGTLTANQALVANSTSGINQVIVGNVSFTGATQTISANGSTGTAGFVLASGGASSNLYWQTVSSFGVNTAAQYTWTNTQTFQIGTVVGANLVSDNTSIRWVGNTTTSPTVTFANSGTISIGNSSTTQTTGQILVQNSAGLSTINAGSITTSTLYANLIGSTANLSTSVNSAVLSVGTNFIANSSQLTVSGIPISANGNVGSGGQVLVSNGATGSPYWAAVSALSGGVNTSYQYTWTNTHTFQAGITVGANLVTDNTSLRWVGNTTTSPTVTIANTGAISVGNSTTTETTASVTLQNSVSVSTLTPLSLAVGNSSVTSAQQIVVQNTAGTTTVNSNYIATTTVGANLVGSYVSVTTANATTFNGTTVNANLAGSYVAVTTANATTFNSGGIFVANTITLNANGLVVNSTGAYVTGLTNSTSFNAGATGTGTGGSVQNTTTIFVGNNTINTVITSAGLAVNGTATIANSTGVYTGVVNGSSITVGSNFIANSTKVTFTGANIDATSAFLKVADAVISGNLVVSGSVVSINVATLIVNDNIIEVGLNNITTDVVDTGWYSPAGNATNIWYSGLVRQAAKSTNTNPYFWLFASNTNPNTAATVDTSANSSTATLQAYLVPYGTGGAFVANSTTVTLTANSTVNVNITANTLSLSTPLPGTSGGTGRASWTSQDILVANATNGINALSVGTGGYVLSVSTCWYSCMGLLRWRNLLIIKKVIIT